MAMVYGKGNAPAGAVYIGRPSKWGNPYAMHGEHMRDAVCVQYEAWIQTQPALLAAAVRELRGKDLVCFCAPRRCHGDTLLRIANA